MGGTELASGQTNVVELRIISDPEGLSCEPFTDAAVRLIAAKMCSADSFTPAVRESTHRSLPAFCRFSEIRARSSSGGLFAEKCKQ
jgi:hypothetical protein